MGPSRAERMTAMADEPVCFVVMGFGKKTDYESGRTLDLDATYRIDHQAGSDERGLALHPRRRGDAFRRHRPEDVRHAA